MHVEPADGGQPRLPLPPGVPEEARWVLERPAEAVSGLLRQVMGLSAQVRHTLRERLGIGPNEFSAMEHLMAEPMGPVELSRRLDLTSAAATVLLHRLESSGHVERRPHPTDRRRQVVVPRPEGTAAVFRELRPMIERLDAVTRQFDEDERAVIARYLAGVVEALEATVAEPPEAPPAEPSAEPPPGPPARTP